LGSGYTLCACDALCALHALHTLGALNQCQE
jgi:hypothetical protein